MKVTDLLGNQIEVGDKIAYGVRDGNRGGILYGEVVDIEDRQKPLIRVEVSHASDGSQRVKPSRLEDARRSVVVEKASKAPRKRSKATRAPKEG